MYAFGTTTSSSSPSNSLPPTPIQGAVINAPVVLDNEVAASPFGLPLRKRLDSTSLRLPPPLFELPFPKEAFRKVVAGSDKGEFYLQHPRRVESQIQLASANGAGQSEDEFVGFRNYSAYRRSQSSPVHYRKPKTYDDDEEEFGGSLRLTSSISRGHDAFDLLESELNDPDNEFAGDLELGRRGLPNACIFVANLAMHRADAHLQQSVFEYFKQFGDRLHVKIRRDQKNMPYSFVQYESESNACRAIKEGRGALLDNRRIRCEAARVNRTLVFTKFDASDFTKDEARALIKENYGPFEMHQIVSDKVTGRMYFFVKFIYRIDAIECYGEMRHSDIWNVDWENDHARGHNSAQLPEVAVEVDHTSIFVGNLNPELVQQIELTMRFSQYGHVLDCNLINTKRHEKSERSTTRNAFAFIKYESEENALDAIASEHGMYHLGKYLHVQKRELHDKYYRNIPQQSNERYAGGGPSSGYQPSTSGYYPNQQQQQQQNFRPRLALQIPGAGPQMDHSNNDASLSEIVGIATRISLQLMGKRGMNKFGNVNQQDVVNQVLADMSINGDTNPQPSIGSGPSSPQTPRNYNCPSTPVRSNYVNGGFGGSQFTTPRNNRGYGSGGYGNNNTYQSNASPTSTVCVSPHYQMPNRGYRRNFPQRPLSSEMTGGGVYLPGNGRNYNGRPPVTVPAGSYSPVGPYPLTYSPQAHHSRNGSIYNQQEEQQQASHHSRNNSAYLRQHRMNLQKFGAPPHCQLNSMKTPQQQLAESQIPNQPSPSEDNDEQVNA